MGGSADPRCMSMFPLLPSMSKSTCSIYVLFSRKEPLSDAPFLVDNGSWFVERSVEMGKPIVRRFLLLSGALFRLRRFPY
jgi:hypothetical protein